MSASVRQDGCSCTVVDVDGSQGRLGIELAQRYAFVRCVVQDLSKTIKHAFPVPLGLQGRVTFMERGLFPRANYRWSRGQHTSMDSSRLVG